MSKTTIQTPGFQCNLCDAVFPESAASGPAAERQIFEMSFEPPKFGEPPLPTEPRHICLECLTHTAEAFSDLQAIKAKATNDTQGVITDEIDLEQEGKWE